MELMDRVEVIEVMLSETLLEYRALAAQLRERGLEALAERVSEYQIQVLRKLLDWENENSIYSLRDELIEEVAR